jgi:hypothetical protein
VSPEFAKTLAGEEQRARKHETKHSYSLAEFGLGKNTLQERLAPLFEEFGWAKAPAASAAVES